MKGGRGFTLIEVVIAISIFALLGLGCYKVVHGLALARDKVSKNAEELRQFTKAINIIGSDFTQLTARKILNGSGQSVSALDTQGDYLVEFSRRGVQNPLMVRRAKVVRIAYRYAKEIDLDDLADAEDNTFLKEIVGDGQAGYFIRYVWPVLDRGSDEDPQMQILLAGIKGVEFEYLDEDRQWDTEWPPVSSQSNSASADLPYAIKLKMDTLKYGSLERLFQVRQLPPP